MSDQKIISPLLDGFTLGAPLSQHHGVVCYPAIKENSNKKYIVKVISVPATQAQFDALILAGAYKDPAEVMDYFRKKGEGLLEEAAFLKMLSRIEGFLPYDGWQMEPITRRRLGYEIYLVGSYKRSLDKYIRKNAFTHLDAVNMGLDLCSALSVCRQAGHIYADLKPSHIYVSEKKEYRIGDLGFLPLDALRYTSLPERYFSPYSPPELQDPMTSVSLSVDTYAVGMILYQLYNDGQLPFHGLTPSEDLPNPCHADYEMAEIIMKAVHSDPEQRWTDPKDLGKAIAAYMQRNNVGDIPITPFLPVDVKEEDIVPVTSSEMPTDETEPVSEEAEEIQEAFKESQQTLAENQEINTEPQEPSQEEFPEQPEQADSCAEIMEAAEDASAEDASEVQAETEDAADEPETSELQEQEPEMPEPSETEPEEPDQMQEPTFEEEPLSVSEEVARILSRADEMIAHEIPEETGFHLEESQADPFAFAAGEPELPEDDLPDDDLMTDEADISIPKKKKTKHFENQTRKNRLKKFFSGCLKLLLLCGLIAAGVWFYLNVYLQPVDSMTIDGTQEQITVLVDTLVEESRLSVSCTGWQSNL